MHLDLELVRDFVNTADLEDGTDDFADPVGLEDWFDEHHLTPDPVQATRRDAAAAIAVREALRELLRANSGFPVDRAAAAETLDAVARRTRLAVRFDSGAIRLVPQSPGVAGALGRVLAAAAASMADGSWPRLKACQSDTCRWAFIDNTNNASRRWCSMSVCGNRAKARAFRRRRG
jgi:predicted RNA-binding Zn ribbon-like protein